VEKASDGDVLRDMIGFAAERQAGLRAQWRCVADQLRSKAPTLAA